MKKSSRMEIEYQSYNLNGTQFGDLEIGDVFRLVDKNRLYIVVRMLAGTLRMQQGVSLDNGGRITINEQTPCVQVKVICSWVDMKP